MTLLALLHRYGDVVEADLQREYHVDLCDLWRGTLTLRKLHVLIEHLPVNSATVRALAGMEPGHPWASWSLTDMLLGRLVDEVAAQRWQWEASHSKRGRPSRRAPASILPEAPALTPRRDSDADVIPLMSPHRLGPFIYDDDQQEGA